MGLSLKIYCFLGFLLMFSQSVDAQLSGLYGDNAAAISVVAVYKGTLEFEPTYGYSRVASVWEDGNLTKLDVAETGTSLTWRVTYGLGSKWEIGFGAPTNLSSLGFSIKKEILTKDVFALGIAAGITESTLEAPMDVAKAPEFKTSYGVALLGYWSLEQSSFDINVQYQNYFDADRSSAPPGLFINGDFGQWIIPGKMRIMMGVGYQNFDNGIARSTLWSLFPALQYDFLNFSAVLNTQHDFAGYNASKSLGLNMTFTTIW